MESKISKRLILIINLLGLLIFNCPVSASHLIQGNITYKYLGDKRYEITLNIFRDVNSGTTFANAEKLCISIPDKNPNIQSRLVQCFFDVPMVGAEENVDLALDQPCVVAPKTMKLAKATYRMVITLDSISSTGYHISYIRCCRNGGIVNVVNPGDYGLALYAFIPPIDKYPINSSPVYRRSAPNFICNNVLFEWDFSAVDPDGDSLAYGLYSPFEEGSQGNINPSIPPPYDSVIFKAPYTPNVMISGNPKLSIDPKSGKLFINSTLTGIYAFGVVTYEYRNGVLISKSYRDVQATLLSCPGATFSSILTPNTIALPSDPGSGGGIPVDRARLECGTRTISFDGSKITGASRVEWDFGDPSVTTDVSTNFSPSYTYTNFGTFPIRVIAYSSNPDLPNCKDTSRLDLLVLPKPNPNFNASFANCNVTAQFNNLEPGGYTGVKQEYTWRFGDATTGNTLNPSHAYPNSGSYTVFFRASFENLCKDSLTKIITVAGKPNFTAGPDQGLCGSQKVKLGLGTASSNYTYSWNPSNGLSSPTTSNPDASPASTTTYILTVKDTVSDCEVSDDVVVSVGAKVDFTLPQDTVICAGSPIIAGPQSQSGLKYTWQPATGVSNPNNSPATINANTTTSYTLSLDNQGCINSKGFIVNVRPKPTLDTGFAQITCTGSYLEIGTDVGTGFNVQWEPTLGLNNPNSSKTQASPSVTTTYRLIVTEPQTQCTAQSVWPITIRTLSKLGRDTSVCPGTSISFGLIPAPGITFVWEEGKGAVGSTEPFITVKPEKTTTYIVKVADSLSGCISREDLIVTLKPVPIFTVDKPYVSTRLGNSMTIGSSNLLNSPYKIEWIPAAGVSDSSAAIVKTRVKKSTDFTLRVYDPEYGCFTEQHVFLKYICGDGDIFVPNAFTPNADGINDKLKIEGRNIVSMDMKIYDRWGNVSYENKDINYQWDGSSGGYDLNPGSYYYTLLIGCVDGDFYNTKGTLTILR